MGWASNTLPGAPSDFQRAFDPDAEDSDYIVGMRPDRPADAEAAQAADAHDPDGSSEIGSLLEDLGFEPVDVSESSSA